jgi:hypothetical protein
MTGHAEPENAEEPADRLDAAELPVADAPAIPESLAPMLDVHAPPRGNPHLEEFLRPHCNNRYWTTDRSRA